MAKRKVEIEIEAKERAKAAIEATTAALKEQNQVVDYAKKLYQQTLTAEEKLEAGIKKLQNSMTSGKVTLMEYTRAMEQLKRESVAAQAVVLSFSQRMASGRGGQAAPFFMNMGSLATAASQLPIYNRSASGMNMATLASANSVSPFVMNMGALATANRPSYAGYLASVRYNSNVIESDRAAGLAEIVESQRSYLAGVRYRSNLAEIQQAAARREHLQGVAGSLDFINAGDNTFLPPGYRPAPGRLSRFGNAAAGYLPYAGIAAGVAGIGGSWHAFMEQDIAEARLRGVLRATGRSDISMEGLLGFAAERQNRTNFGDETTLGAAAVLSTFQHIKGSQFTATLKAAQDLSTVMGTDLETSALKLGKALEAPDDFMKQLARSGIVLSDSVQKQIVELTKQGDLTEAQTMLLEEMNKRMGDAAVIASESASGSWFRLKNAMSDVGEVIGQKLLPVIDLMAGGMRGFANLASGNNFFGGGGNANDVLAGYYDRQKQGAGVSFLGRSHLQGWYNSSGKDLSAIESEIDSLGVRMKDAPLSARREMQIRVEQLMRSKWMIEDERKGYAGQLSARSDKFNNRLSSLSGALGITSLLSGGIPVTARGAFGNKQTEARFREWYSRVSSAHDLAPDPDDPLHQYDWRKAYQSGATADAFGHWPSTFKLAGHPNRFVDGEDTITGLAQGSYSWISDPRRALTDAVNYAKRRYEEIKPGIRSMEAAAKLRADFLEKSQTPEDARRTALKQLDEMGGFLTPAQRTFRLKEINEEYERDTKVKKESTDRRHHDDSLRAVESRFLTRSSGLSPELMEARKAFQQRATTNKLLTNIDKKLKSRPKVISKF